MVNMNQQKNKPHSYEYPRPSVTVDGLVFGFDPEKLTLEVLLMRRASDTFDGFWALPGGFVEVSDGGSQGESLDTAVRREIQEETGANIEYLEQLYTFGDTGRDPRGRVISIAYFGLVRTKSLSIKSGSDASEAAWFSIEEALQKTLAFDHNKILTMGIQRLQAKIRYSPIGIDLLPTRFSLWDLQKLYEAILLGPLNKNAFRKQVLFYLDGILDKAGTEMGPVSRRPAQLYSFNKDAYSKAIENGGLNFEISQTIVVTKKI
jgi:8-oxo-dGTP diphosphatase